MGKIKWDAVGAFLSGLCMVHCVALPLFLLMAPAISTIFLIQEGLTHAILFGLVLTAAALAFIPGYRVHKHPQPLVVSSVGLLLLLVATFLTHGWLGHHWEPILAIGGSSLLICAHWLNHAKCKSCTQHSCGHEGDKHSH